MPSSPGQTLTTHHYSIVNGRSLYACHSFIEPLVGRATDNMSSCAHSAAVHVLGGQSPKRAFSNWFCLSLIFPLDDSASLCMKHPFFSVLFRNEKMSIFKIILSGNDNFG